MVTVETISIVFTGLSVSLAAFYYISPLRNAQRTRELALKAQEQALVTRQTQLLMHIDSLRHTTDWHVKYLEVLNSEWTDYDDFTEKYGSPETQANFLSVGSYFEGIGVLVKNGLIDPELVDDLLSASIILWWERMGPILLERRKRMNLPQYAEYSEYLYNEIRKIAEEQHPELRT